MNIQRDIPGYGKLNNDYVKVSSRVPERLAQLIDAQKKPALSRILPDACSKFGGFGDGHSVAASGVILSGEEEEFIEELDRLAGQDAQAGSLDTFV
jgi:hypothetical protein